MPIQIIDSKQYEKVEKNNKESEKVQRKLDNDRINDKYSEKKGISLNDLLSMSRGSKPIPNNGPNVKKLANEIKAEEILEKHHKEKIVEAISSEEAERLRHHSNTFIRMPYNWIVNDTLKQKLFENNVNQNKVMNDIVNEEFIAPCTSFLPKRIRFFMHYGLEIMETEEQYEKIMLQYQLKQSQAAQPVQPEHHTVEPSTVECDI